jgi:hypothetical protein
MIITSHVPQYPFEDYYNLWRIIIFFEVHVDFQY